MTASPFDHPVLAGLVGDVEIAPFFTPEAELTEMARFEVALAQAEAAEGLIPAPAAEAIATGLVGFEPDLTALRQSTARDGVVVPGLVAQWRTRIGVPYAQHLHLGATSQDLIDTSLILRLRPVLEVFDGRLGALIGHFDALARQFGAREIMGRTRMQDARPITVSERIASWRAPLVRHRQRLAEFSPRLFVVQFGGAVGSLDTFGIKGAAVARRLGATLDLGVPDHAWHSQRDPLAECAGWLSLVTGSLGKLGQDVALMAQNAIAEIGLSNGGKSSAMPHKSNPVGAEVLVALARYNGGLVASMHQSLVHEQERSGAAWTLEWLTLPQMLFAAGASLRTALVLTESITRLGNGEA